MTVKIGDIRGYGINYDSRSRKFTLTNEAGEDVGEGNTQDEVEVQAEKLAKTKFPFPILALTVSQGMLFTGKVTSLNLEDRCAWFSYDDKSSWRTRGKEYLHSSHMFELTEPNKAIIVEVAKQHAIIEQNKAAIMLLIERLEKPIDLKFFGLEY